MDKLRESPGVFLYLGPRQTADFPVGWDQLMYGALCFPQKGITNYHYPKGGDPSDKWDVIERLARQTLFSGVFCLNLWIQGLVPILRQHLGR